MPLKNIATVAGRPCLAYAVNALREATVPLRSILITDHQSIASVGRELGLDVLDEPPELADDDAVDETKLLRLALKEIETASDQFEFVLLHYACVPVRPRGIVDGMIRFLKKTKADFVQTAAPVDPHNHPYRHVYRTPDGRMADFVPKSSSIMSQGYVPLYARTAASIGVRRDALTDSDRPHDRRCLIHGADECVDIDEPSDILWAEFLLQRQRRSLATPNFWANR